MSGMSWYLPVRGERAVERRVLAIHREYRTAAALADQRHHGRLDGPISQRLATLILVGAAFGRFGEAADTVHKLVTVMAEARVKQQTLAWGREEVEEKAHLSVETGYIRRRISCASVTAFGQRLVSRMSGGRRRRGRGWTGRRPGRPPSRART